MQFHYLKITIYIWKLGNLYHKIYSSSLSSKLEKHLFSLFFRHDRYFYENSKENFKSLQYYIPIILAIKLASIFLKKTPNHIL